MSIIDKITGIEVEAVVGGCLQKITFASGVNPAEIKVGLLELDASAKVREDFPARGSFGGQGRETKLARVLVVNAQARNGGKFITLTAQTAAGEDLSISVSKKRADGWAAELAALGKVSDKNMEKIKAALDGGKPATAILPEAEQFGAKYFQMDDGGAFLDGMQADAPTVEG